MPATLQSLTEGELDIVSLRAPHEPFICIDNVLEAFDIPHLNKFEADGTSTAYLTSHHGTT